MSVIRGLKRGLIDVTVDKEEVSTYSKYFNVYGWKEEYSKGFHTLTISGSSLLKKQTYIKVEILDSGGRPIPINLPSSSASYEDNYLPSRRIGFEITDETLNGVATITFIGETKEGETVRFTRTFTINKNIPSKPVRFRDEWEDDEYYEVNDVVNYDGASYIATLNHEASSETEPPNDTYWNVFAEKGIDGKIVKLFSTDQAFTFDGEGEPDPEEQVITFNVETQNLEDTSATWETRDQNNDVISVLTNITQTPTSAQLSVDDFEQYDKVIVKVTIDGISDQITINKVKSGENAKFIKIVAGGQTFKKDQNGDITPENLTLEVERFNVDGDAKWIRESDNEELGDSDTLVVEPSDILDDYSTIRVEIGNFTDKISLAILEDGADTFTALLSRSFHGIPTDRDGDNEDFTDAESTVTVFRGAEDVTDNFDIGIGTETSGSLSFTLDGNTVSINGMSSDTGSFVFELTPKTGFEDIYPSIITKVFTLVKVKQGEKGDLGLSLNFRGIWESGETYNTTDISTDVVLRGISYYYLDPEVSESTGDDPENDDPWIEFQNQFESIATDLLLAKNVTIRQILTMGSSAEEDNAFGANGIIRSLGAYDDNGIITYDQADIENNNYQRFFELSHEGLDAWKGSIGGFEIEQDHLKSTENRIRLNSDGSGHLANGKIIWDTFGNTDFLGLISVGDPTSVIIDGDQNAGINTPPNLNISSGSMGDFSVNVGSAGSIVFSNEIVNVKLRSNIRIEFEVEYESQPSGGEIQSSFSLQGRETPSSKWKMVGSSDTITDDAVVILFAPTSLFESFRIVSTFQNSDPSDSNTYTINIKNINYAVADPTIAVTPDGIYQRTLMGVDILGGSQVTAGSITGSSTWINIFGKPFESVGDNLTVNNGSLTTDLSDLSVGLGLNGFDYDGSIAREFTIDTSIVPQLNQNNTFTQNMTIQGDLHVLGTEFIANTETVEIEDNLGVINSGEEGDGITAGFAGWRVDRGTLDDFLFGFQESNEAFSVGKDGSTLQAIATREDNPIDEALAFWNTSENRLYTSSSLTWNGSILTASNFSGDGSLLTDLNASELVSGTVPTGRIDGNYGGITGVGDLDGGSITSGFGDIDIGNSDIIAGDAVFATLLINGTTTLLDNIFLNDFQLTNIEDRKIFSNILEVNNLETLSVGEVEILNEPLRDGVEPLSFTSFEISYVTSAGGYARFADVESFIETEIDATGLSDLMLEFDVAKFGVGGDGPIAVETSIDNGNTWQFQGLSPTPTGSDYLTATISIDVSEPIFLLRWTRQFSPSQKRMRDVVLTGQELNIEGGRYEIYVNESDTFVLRDVNQETDLLFINDDGDITSIGDITAGFAEFTGATFTERITVTDFTNPSIFSSSIQVGSAHKVGIGANVQQIDNKLFVQNESEFTPIGLRNADPDGFAGFTTISDDNNQFGWVMFNNSDNSSPYSGVIGTTANASILLQTQSTTRFTVRGDGNVSFSEDLQAGSSTVIDSNKNIFANDIEGNDATLSGKLEVDGTSQFGSYIQSDNWENRLIGWGEIDTEDRGHFDFRSVYTDELIARTFISETTLSLAGSDYLTKSNATLSESVFIEKNATEIKITVDDHEGLKGFQVFEEGDYIRLRVQDRFGDNGFIILNIWGTVSGYEDNENGTQTWDVTIEHPPERIQDITLQAGSVILDYGKDGNGIIERSALGKGTPFDRIFTWHDKPWKTEKYILQTHIGNLGLSEAYVSEEYLEYVSTAEQDGYAIQNDSKTRKAFNLEKPRDLFGAYFRDQVLIELGTGETMMIGKNIGGMGRHGYKIDANNYHYGTGEFKVYTDDDNYIEKSLEGFTIRIEDYLLKANNLLMSSQDGGTLEVGDVFKASGETQEVVFSGFTATENTLYSGEGNFENEDTPIYFNSDTGNFSLKNKFVWNNTELKIIGDVTATNLTIDNDFSLGNIMTVATNGKIQSDSDAYELTDTGFLFGNGLLVGDENELIIEGSGVSIIVEDFDLTAGDMTINSTVGIQIDNDNYFRQNKEFSFGGGLLSGDGSTLSISGTGTSINVENFVLSSSSSQSEIILGNVEIDGSGNMTLGNKFTWDGSELTIDGTGTFSGDLTADSLTINTDFSLGNTMTVASGGSIVSDTTGAYSLTDDGVSFAGGILTADETKVTLGGWVVQNTVFESITNNSGLRFNSDDNGEGSIRLFTEVDGQPYDSYIVKANTNIISGDLADVMNVTPSNITLNHTQGSAESETFTTDYGISDNELLMVASCELDFQQGSGQVIVSLQGKLEGTSTWETITGKLIYSDSEDTTTIFTRNVIGYDEIRFQFRYFTFSSSDNDLIVEVKNIKFTQYQPKIINNGKNIFIRVTPEIIRALGEVGDGETVIAPTWGGILGKPFEIIGNNLSVINDTTLTLSDNISVDEITSDLLTTTTGNIGSLTISGLEDQQASAFRFIGVDPDGIVSVTGNFGLSNLVDVSLTNEQNGQFLRRVGGEWVNQTLNIVTSVESGDGVNSSITGGQLSITLDYEEIESNLSFDNYSSWQISSVDIGGETNVESSDVVRVLGGDGISTSRSGLDITIVNDGVTSITNQNNTLTLSSPPSGVVNIDVDMTLSQHTDVNTSEIESGQILKWDGGEWIPEDLPVVPTIHDLVVSDGLTLVGTSEDNYNPASATRTISVDNSHFGALAFINDLSTFTTDDLDEAETNPQNLYFTDQRAIDAIKNDDDWNASEWDIAYNLRIEGVIASWGVENGTPTWTLTVQRPSVDDIDINFTQTLSQHTDVIISTPENGEILQYNGSNWVNNSIDTGVQSINDPAPDPSYLIVDGTTSNVTIQVDYNALVGALDSEYLSEETDPVFTASPASDITNTDIGNWDEAYQYSLIEHVESVLSGNGINVSVTDKDYTISLNATLNQLNDVIAPTPTEGDILQYDGENWVLDSLPPIPQIFALSAGDGINFVNNDFYKPDSATNTISIDQGYFGTMIFEDKEDYILLEDFNTHVNDESVHHTQADIHGMFSASGNLSYDDQGTFSYTHPSDGGGDIEQELTGGDVISQIRINDLGHVTSTSTRTLTTDDINELQTNPQNLYFTDQRAIDAIKNDDDWNASAWDIAYEERIDGASGAWSGNTWTLTLQKPQSGVNDLTVNLTQTLTQHTDVNAPNPENNYILRYNSSEQEWQSTSLDVGITQVNGTEPISASTQGSSVNVSLDYDDDEFSVNAQGDLVLAQTYLTEVSKSDVTQYNYTHGDLGLTTDLSNYDNSTTGFISDYTVTSGDVTAHEGDLSILVNQVTDFDPADYVNSILTNNGLTASVISNGQVTLGISENGIPLNKLASGEASQYQILHWNGSSWSPTNPPNVPQIYSLFVSDGLELDVDDEYDPTSATRTISVDSTVMRNDSNQTLDGNLTVDGSGTFADNVSINGLLNRYESYGGSGFTHLALPNGVQSYSQVNIFSRAPYDALSVGFRNDDNRISALKLLTIAGNSTRGVRFLYASSTASGINEGLHIIESNNSTTSWRINDGNVTMSGTHTATDHQGHSDIRIKTLLQSDINAREIAQHANLHLYDKRGLIQYGLIAQDLMKYDERLVGTTSDDEFGEIYTLSGYSIASIALAGVKELDNELLQVTEKTESNKKRIEKLEQENSYLKEKVKELGGIL